MRQLGVGYAYFQREVISLINFFLTHVHYLKGD